MSKQIGRPKKYSSKQLMMIIDKFKEEFPLADITYAKLSAYANIPYYIWRDNREMNQYINSTKNNISKENFEEIILRNMYSKDRLIDTAECYYNNDLNRIKAKINDYKIEKENKKLKQIKKALREQIDTEIKRIKAYEKSINKYCYK
jgi:hypothetical protein